VIRPYLRARGISALDTVVVSHGDLDHVGGAASVLRNLPVGRLMASYDLPGQLALRGGPLAFAPGMSFTACAAGQAWNVDGVTFSMLHPDPQSSGTSVGRSSRERNEASCVLRVQGKFHSALMTGDIAISQENAMVAHGGLAADVVMAAHHGSKGSSGPAFVAAVRAAHAVAQAGYLNSYRHPHPSVVARWQDAGTIFHRSDRDGAVVFTSRADGLRVERERERRRRYWHGS